MNNLTVNEIDELIVNLHKEKQKIIAAEDEKEFLSLEWTRGLDAKLEFNSLSTYGLHKYTITILSEPKFNKYNFIYGDDKSLYTDAVVYHPSNWNSKLPVIASNSHENMMKFIKNSYFNKIEYSETFKEISELYNYLNNRKGM